MAAQSITWNTPSTAQNPQPRFCALGFRSHNDDLPGGQSPTIIAVLLDPQGRFRVLVHPEIRNLYHGDDLEYIDAIVWDLVDRGRLEPENLIKHLCSLGGVGPLVPTNTGDVRRDAFLLSGLSIDLTEV